jgi:hypothetical protein
VVSFLAYPNLLGNKMLGCCCCCEVYKSIWAVASPLTNLLFFRFSWRACKFSYGDKVSNDWWRFFDRVCNIISNLNIEGPSKLVPKSPNVEAASLGQRAAVVASGGFSNALGTNRFADQVTMLRDEILPRVFFHLVILYLCKAGLENASNCVLQFMSLLPVLISEDDQRKNKLHLLIWYV